ncbi:MAG: hypothetical protein HMLKMBBP_01635 [Planctomycetes bacterium]|nr:hypothetical protein [Planctomycetota bacterium]
MVSATLGVDLQPYEGDAEDLFARFLGLELSLHACDLERDRGIDFSRYQFILSTRTPWGDADLRAYQLEATALAAYTLLVRGTPREGILVHEVQRLLARYTVSPEGQVRDSVSGAAVSFPRHLQDLRARIDGAAG